MTRDAIFFTFGAVVAGAIVVASITRPITEHGRIVCHADGSAFVGHIDLQGIGSADLVNAVQMMCRFKRERTV